MMSRPINARIADGLDARNDPMGSQKNGSINGL